MNKLTGYGLGALALAVLVGLLLDIDTVQRIESDAGPGSRVGEVSQNPFERISRPNSRLAVGQRYTSQAELTADQQAAGYVKVGSFGNNWPARVTEIATGRDEISFVRQNGTPHHYSKFAGYSLKMVRLLDGRKETIVVFRSQEKR